MRAYVQNGYGDCTVLSVKELPMPVITNDQILVKVKAFSINDWDYGNMTGKPFFNRIFQGTLTPKDVILGADIAGEVIKVGSSIRDYKVGDRVYGDLSENNFGGFCEYVAIPPDAVIHMDDSMTFEQAAAVPQAGLLAYGALFEYGKIRDGMKILVNGAGGGVGTYIVQMVKQYNDIHITGVDTGEKLTMMKTIGYDEVIDFNEVDYIKNGQKYDLVVDNKMSHSVFSVMGSLTDGGIFATTGGLARFYSGAFFLSWLIRLIYKKESKLVILRVNQNLDYFNKMFSKGKIKSVIDGSYSFEQFPEAMQHYYDNKHKGKVVIKIE